MKALFLAGGKGTRLRPLTDKVPKPMVPVMGEPLLKRSIEKAKTHGVREVVLSTCYRADYFANYFRSVNPGVKLRFITEESPLGTGGAIKNAQPFFDSPFLVFNADIVSDIDYRKMWEFHKEKKADVTIAVTYVEDPTAYGVIEFDDEGFVRTFKEKPKPHEVTSTTSTPAFISSNPMSWKQSRLDGRSLWNGKPSRGSWRKGNGLPFTGGAVTGSTWEHRRNTSGSTRISLPAGSQCRARISAGNSWSVYAKPRLIRPRSSGALSIWARMSGWAPGRWLAPMW